MSGIQTGSKTCGCGRGAHETRLVAVTGGPGAGKTAILEMALRSFCAHVGVLPEAASVVFGGGFPRHSTDIARRAAQRAIYHVQREIEAVVVGERQVAVGLCDRGTVDGVAYWPGSAASYWEELGTTAEAELRRYAAVIHLETPAADQGYNHQNALRVESPTEARALDRRILAAWAGHPNHAVVSSADDFVQKAARALELVRAQLSPCCHGHALPHESRPERERDGA
ncbi:MAG: ATP-binding protein [Nannocystaceae bacterium]|nr:ATP-binding protein [Myxococcales bacterium]